MKYILFIILIITAAAVWPLEPAELDSIYSRKAEELDKLKFVLDIYSSGRLKTELGPMAFRTIARDYADSVAVLTMLTNEETGDSSFISYILKKNHLKTWLDTDINSIGSTVISVEPFFVYRGHHMGVLLSNSFSIEDKPGSFLILSNEQNPLIDSIYIHKNNFMPLSFRVHRYNYDLKVFINKYREPFPGLFIPDRIVYTKDNDTVFISAIDSINKRSK